MSRRRFLTGLTATATGSWLGSGAWAGVPQQVPQAIAAEAPVHWFVGAGQQASLGAVQRQARAGDAVRALPARFDPAWAAEQLQRARAQGAEVAAVVSAGDAFLLGQIARDAGWRVGESPLPLAQERGESMFLRLSPVNIA